MEIRNHTFLVTGGASGLGAATARALHADGANVVIADLNGELGDTLATELGERATFAHTDVTSEAHALAAIDLACTRFGALHGLVHCAGIGTAARVLGREGPMPLQEFEKSLRVNLLGCFNMVRLCADAMQGNEPTADGERGVLVATASIAAYEGQLGQAAYAAAKGGIVSMTLPIAREFARLGIRMMTIAPGLFLTPMMHTLPPDVQQALGESVPFPARLGDPQEFARLALAIITNPMLNGETIRIDGALRLAPR